MFSLTCLIWLVSCWIPQGIPAEREKAGQLQQLCDFFFPSQRWIVWFMQLMLSNNLFHPAASRSLKTWSQIRDKWTFSQFYPLKRWHGDITGLYQMIQFCFFYLCKNSMLNWDLHLLFSCVTIPEPKPRFRNSCHLKKTKQWLRIDTSAPVLCTGEPTAASIKTVLNSNQQMWAISDRLFVNVAKWASVRV